MSARAPRLWPWILAPVVALVAIVTFAVVGFLAYGTAGAVSWPWWGFFPWFPFVGIGIFFGLLFLVFVLRGFGRPWNWNGGWSRGTGDDSGAILRERYARGEITREQFGEMRRELDEHRTQNAYDDDRAGSGGP